MESLVKIINSQQFNLFYNLVIVGFLFIAAIIYYKHYRKLKNDVSSLKVKLMEIKELDRDQVIMELQDYFSNRNKDTLKTNWDAYFDKLQNISKDGVSQEGIVDPLDFFHSELLINQLTSRKQFDLMPGIFVTLGIFGTFLGLAAGLYSINLSGAAQDMKNSIDQLLEGMKFAFYSSVIGIFSSLIWTTFDKLISLPNTMRKLRELENQLDQLLTITGEQILLENLLKVQRENSESLKTLVSDTIIPEMMNEFSKILRDNVVPHMTTQTQAIQNMANNQSKENNLMIQHFEEQTKAFNEFAQNTANSQMESMDIMVGQFIDRLTQVTGEQFEAINETLRDTIEMHEVVHQNLMDLISELQDTAVHQAKLHEIFNDIGDKFNDKVDTIISLQEELKDTLSKLIKAGELIENQNERTIQLQSIIEELWEKSANEQEYLQTVNEKIREDLEYHINQMDARIHRIDDSWGATEETLKGINQQFYELNGQLSNSIQNFSDHMHQGLTKTFTQFDDQLSKAIEHLASGVGSLEEITSDLPEQIEEFTVFVRKLTEINNEVAVATEIKGVNDNVEAKK